MKMSSLVLSIEGLTLESNLRLGHVLMYGSELGNARYEELLSKPEIPTRLVEVLKSSPYINRTIVEIEGDDIAVARAHLRECVDVLTALTLRSNRSKNFGHFGLPEDVVSKREEVIRAGATGVGISIRHVGHFIGLELSGMEITQLVESREYKFLHSALIAEIRNAGQNRALKGCWYFAKSVRELDDDISVLLASAAIEAWILVEREVKPTYNAARAIAWFSCLGVDNRCGRDRAPCPYLLLDPRDDRDSKRLRKLKDLHDQREASAREARRATGQRAELLPDGWTCSQWSRGAKWYDMRSVVAHGRVSDDPNDIAELEEERHNKRYWIAGRVLDAVLNWLEEHPITPAEDLVEALSSLRKPDNWETILELIDGNVFDQPCPYTP